MSTDLDLIIKRLESELNNGGLAVDKNKDRMVNNFFEEEKSKVIINPNLKFKNYYNNTDYKKEINEMKQKMESDFYEHILKLKSEMKNFMDGVNKKMLIYDNELKKCSSVNDNLNKITVSLSELENNYNVMKRDLKSTRELELSNKNNIEISREIFKQQIDNNNENVNKLEGKVNEMSNLMKQKDNISSELTQKLAEYTNKINKENDQIKEKIEISDNNNNLLNEITNIKSNISNISSQINDINSKMEEIYKEKEDLKAELNNLRNDIQATNNDIKEMKLYNENKEIENKKIENDISEMKKNIDYMEKKINNFDENINYLDNNINDNKNEIIQIKKKLGNKPDLDLVKKESNISNDLNINEFNNKLNELNLKYENNDKKYKNLETLFNNKINEINLSFNNNFDNLNKFKVEQLKLNIENQEIIKHLSDKMIQNSKKLDDAENYFNSNLEVINKNLQISNKYFIKVKEMDKIVKDIAKP